jgi:hypothetical protein
MLKTSEEIRQGYRQRLLLPEFPPEGELIEFRTKSGTLVAVGYERVVIGDRGPYVEFAPSSIMKSGWAIPADQKWRIDGRCYYVEGRTVDGANVKMYYQKATVDYADYKVGMWYISPFVLTTDQWPVLIEPLEKA